jgi:hypothetical protein
VSGVRIVGDPQAEIEAVCEVHQGSGHLVIRRAGNRIVLDERTDECCVIVLEGAAVTHLAVCGAQVLAASLTAPQRSRCPVCTRGAR